MTQAGGANGDDDRYPSGRCTPTTAVFKRHERLRALGIDVSGSILYGMTLEAGKRRGTVFS